MARRCKYCQERPKPLNCEKLTNPNVSRCRRSREKGIQCISSNVGVVADQFSRRKTSAAANSTSRTLRRLHPSRASEVPVVAESIETDVFDTTLQETVTRPTQDSLSGNVWKILIALDIGSDNIKAAWKAVYTRQKRRVLVDRLVQDCEAATWSNGQPYCLAQIAYKVVDGDEGRFHLQKFWGTNVNDALEQGDLVERDVLEWIKPVIFNYEEEESLRSHKGQFQKRLDRLKMMAEDSDIPEDKWKDIDELSVYSGLMGLAFQFVCGKIREGFPQLRLASNDLTQKTLPRFEVEVEVEVEVALPVPAGSLSKHIKMMLEAAKRACLPNPFSVAEPTAAIAYYLQKQTETSTDQRMVDTQTVLLLDAGEGSLDATLCSITPRTGVEPANLANPMTFDETSSSLPESRYVLQEEVAGLTEWAGGSFANQACHEWLEQNFDTEFDEMLRQPMHKDRYKTKANIINGVVREFERKKRKFSANLGFSMYEKKNLSAPSWVSKKQDKLGQGRTN